MFRISIYLIFVIIITQVVHSQDFEVSPIIINFYIEPGETQTVMLTIKNHSAKSETFLLSVGDILFDKKGKKHFLSANSTKFSCADWLVISPSFLEIGPVQEKNIEVTLQVPDDEFGSRWATINVRTAREQDVFAVDQGISAGLFVSSQIVIEIYQSPKSNKDYQVNINRLIETTIPEDTIRKFNANVENIGGKITNCKVYLIAASIETLEEFQFDPIVFKVFPKSSRSIDLTIPNYLPKGQYSLSAILDYGSATSLKGTQTMIVVE